MHVWLYVVGVLYMVSDAGRPRGETRAYPYPQFRLSLSLPCRRCQGASARVGNGVEAGAGHRDSARAAQLGTGAAEAYPQFRLSLSLPCRQMSGGQCQGWDRRRSRSWSQSWHQSWRPVRGTPVRSVLTGADTKSIIGIVADSTLTRFLRAVG